MNQTTLKTYKLIRLLTEAGIMKKVKFYNNLIGSFNNFIDFLFNLYSLR